MDAVHIDIVPRDKWLDPKAAKRCQFQDCGKEFGFFATKGNCYCCGIVCCENCLRNKTKLPPAEYEERPVCRKCYAKVKQKREKAQLARVRGPNAKGDETPPANTSFASPVTASASPVVPDMTPAAQPHDDELLTLRAQLDALRAENERLRAAADAADRRARAVAEQRDKNPTTADTSEQLEQLQRLLAQRNLELDAARKAAADGEAKYQAAFKIAQEKRAEIERLNKQLQDISVAEALTCVIPLDECRST